MREIPWVLDEVSLRFVFERAPGKTGKNGFSAESKI
jgi:hypothetical protein